jgi:hypothetical protein
MYVVSVFQGIASAVPILLLTVAQVFGQNPGTSVEIDLEEQTAYLLQNGRPVLATPISSGRYGHITMLRRRNGFADPRFGPPFDPRFAPPFWWQ